MRNIFVSQHRNSSERNKVLIAWVTVCPRSVIWSQWLHPHSHPHITQYMIMTIVTKHYLPCSLYFSHAYYQGFLIVHDLINTEHHEQRICSWESKATDDSNISANLWNCSLKYEMIKFLHVVYFLKLGTGNLFRTCWGLSSILSKLSFLFLSFYFFSWVSLPCWELRFSVESFASEKFPGVDLVSPGRISIPFLRAFMRSSR